MSTNDRILPGVAMMIGFCAVAPLIDVAAKLAAATIPVGQITTARFLGQALLMAPIALGLGLRLRLSRRLTAVTLARAVLLIGSTFSFVAAVAVMPVADALAIVFVEPFLLLLLGWLIFGDQVGPRRIGACAVGFLGALLVIRPSLALFGTAALYPLATAFFFALYMLVTRSLAAHVHPVAMQLQTALYGSAICLPAMFVFDGSGLAALDPVWPGGVAWLWLAGVGLAATVSHMAITYALKFAPSATLAPLHYLELVTAVILGYAVFGDFPAALTWAGIGVIVGSGLYVIHRERITARRGIGRVPVAPGRDAA